MPEISNRIIQCHNIGLVQGIHYGDNVFYNSSATAHLTPKHVALEMHKKVMAEWKISGTCEWLMEESHFQSWKKIDTECCFLWLYGRLGCGKSTLMSRLIENIGGDESSTSPTPLLLYFYVSYGDDQEKERLYRTMWMTFWEQAVGKAEERAIDTFGHDISPKKIEEELYRVLATSQRNIYMVIDAIDQFNVHSHDILLQSLSSMAIRFGRETGGFHLRVAISSRDCNGIDQLRAHEVFPIEVTAENNQKDIDAYLEENLTSALFRKKPQLRKQVIEELSKMADGMFLWVSLQTFTIRDFEMETQVLITLKHLILPEKMRLMYEAYADGFESLEELIKKQITQRTMSLLANSSGTMSKEVMLVALSLNDNGEVNPVVHEDLTADPTLVVRFCHHLVCINEKLGVFQFSHKSIFEFFSNYKSATYSRRVAELCLSYLCSAKFSQDPRSEAAWCNPNSLAAALQQHPFLPFACSKWAISVKQSLESERNPNIAESHVKILNMLRILFKKDSSIENRENLQLAFQVHLLTLGKRIPKGVCHEHIVCYFGLVKLFDIFMKRKWFDLEKVDDDELVPIHWAIRNEFELDDVKLTVEKLIEYGASVNVRDKNGRTPLYYACYYGNLQVVQLLVDRHAQLNDVNRGGETALIASCRKHRHDIVPYLIKAGSDVKIQSSFGTALQAISLIGCCSCSEAILDGLGKSKIIEGDGPFGTALHAAALNGHAELVKLLCSRLPNTHATHPTYGSPLTAAATGFNPGMDPAPFKEIIEELVKYGINVNDRSGLVGPALRAAAYQGGEDLVRLLLEKGAKIRKATGPMGTAYEGAAERGHQTIRDILLKHDPKAAEYGKAYVIKLPDQHQLRRKIFRTTVKTSSMEAILGLVTKFKASFEREIRNGDTSNLRTLVKLAEDAFHDVTILAATSDSDSNIPTDAPKHGIDGSRLWKTKSSFNRTGVVSEEDQMQSGNRPRVEPFSYFRRSSIVSVQDSLGEYFPQTLDYMVQAAAEILEGAIADRERQVITLIANAWVEALDKLVSHFGLGESILKSIVQRRVDELKQVLFRKDLSLEERFRRAKAQAQVAIELLLAAIERKQKFRYLCSVLSRLWIEVVTDVEKLGQQGEALVRGMVYTFSENFSTVIAIHDPMNAETYSQAGIELLRATVLIPSATLLQIFSNEWITLWGSALEKRGNMGDMAKRIVFQRQEEYRECLTDQEKSDEALSLALASLEMLRAAFEQRSELAASVLQPAIEASFQLSRASYTSCDSPTKVTIHARNLRFMLIAVIRLFVAAEEFLPGRLNTLALEILDLIGAVPCNVLQELKCVFKGHIDEVNGIAYRHEREKQLMKICSTIVALLDAALGAREQNISMISELDVALRHLAIPLPNFMENPAFTQYTEAVGYLKSRDIS